MSHHGGFEALCVLEAEISRFRSGRQRSEGKFDTHFLARSDICHDEWGVVLPLTVC